MKKLLIFFTGIALVLTVLGCEVEEVGEVRFDNDTGSQLNGARCGDLERVPLATGYSGYEDVEKGTHNVELLNGSGTWVSVGTLSVPADAKGTVRFYVVGDSILWNVISESKSSDADAANNIEENLNETNVIRVNPDIQFNQFVKSE